MIYLHHIHNELQALYIPVNLDLKTCTVISTPPDTRISSTNITLDYRQLKHDIASCLIAADPSSLKNL
jgi:hypothetical protein